MAIILSIETSTEVCSVAIHKKGDIASNQTHQVEKSHSSLLPGIIQEICKKAKVDIKNLSAVAISGGPGSYTGLRIGASTAKGISYALKVPLIAVPTLDIMLESVRNKFKGSFHLCPMMDARRMEVYLKLEDHVQNEIWKPQARILSPDTFSDFDGTLYVFGNGMPKFREIANQPNLIFIDEIFPDASYMGRLAWAKFQKNDFEDTAYFEPNYLKEWRTTVPKKQLI